MLIVATHIHYCIIHSTHTYIEIIHTTLVNLELKTNSDNILVLIMFSVELYSKIEASSWWVFGNFVLTCRCFSLSFHFLLPHILYQYLPDPKRPALKMKERNFTLCQKKEWKLRAVSDNWACRKRHVNNRRRCTRLVTPYPGWQTLSAVDELF